MQRLQACRLNGACPTTSIISASRFEHGQNDRRPFAFGQSFPPLLSFKLGYHKRYWSRGWRASRTQPLPLGLCTMACAYGGWEKIVGMMGCTCPKPVLVTCLPSRCATWSSHAAYVLFFGMALDCPFLPWGEHIWEPEMAAPICGRLAFFGFLLLENPNAHKILLLGGGGRVFLEEEGGSGNFIFMGAGIFLSNFNCNDPSWLQGQALLVTLGAARPNLISSRICGTSLRAASPTDDVDLSDGLSQDVAATA